MSNFIPYENYKKVVNELLDANAENMILESKVTSLETNLAFEKETKELYHAKFKAMFFENRRLQRENKQLKSKINHESADQNTTAIVPVDERSMNAPDWTAPALGKRTAEDNFVYDEEDSEVISDAVPIDDSSSDNEDEDEPDVIPHVQPSVPEALPQVMPEAASEEVILELPSTIPPVIASPVAETPPRSDLLALPSGSNSVTITSPQTKSSGCLRNKRPFSSTISSIPAKRQGKRFICRKESCERTNGIFNSMEAYRSHTRSSHPTLKFLCRWCPYATAYKGSLKEHESIHIDNDLQYDQQSASKSAICQVCNVKFSSGMTAGYNNAQLKRHNRMFH